MQSLRAQAKNDQAVMIEKRFQKAWNRAEVTLTASRFLGEAKTSVAATKTAISGLE